MFIEQMLEKEWMLHQVMERRLHLQKRKKRVSGLMFCDQLYNVKRNTKVATVQITPSLNGYSGRFFFKASWTALDSANLSWLIFGGPLSGHCRPDLHICLFHLWVCQFDLWICIFDLRVSWFNLRIFQFGLQICLCDLRVCRFNLQICLFDLQVCLFDLRICLFDLRVCQFEGMPNLINYCVQLVSRPQINDPVINYLGSKKLVLSQRHNVAGAFSKTPTL